MFFFLKTEGDKNSANNSFQTGTCWSVVPCFRAGNSSGAKQPELTNILFKVLTTKLCQFCCTPSCLTPGRKVCVKRGTRSLQHGYQRHTGIPKPTVPIPQQMSLAAAPFWQNAASIPRGPCSNTTPLSREGYIGKQGNSNSCLSTKHKVSQGWPSNGTPINTRYVLS